MSGPVPGVRQQGAKTGILFIQASNEAGGDFGDVDFPFPGGPGGHGTEAAAGLGRVGGSDATGGEIGQELVGAKVVEAGQMAESGKSGLQRLGPVLEHRGVFDHLQGLGQGAGLLPAEAVPLQFFQGTAQPGNALAGVGGPAFCHHAALAR